jgi:hypothetical protein
MTIILRQADDLAGIDTFVSWLAVTGTTADFDPALKVQALAERLEAAFENCRDLWWELGRKMAEDSSAETAHAPTGGVYGSDFGLMLAWISIIEELADDPNPHLVVCDDPWVFRQIVTLAGVNAGSAPSLLKEALRLRFRGFAARMSVAGRSIRAWLKLRSYRRVFSGGEATLLVYGHPASDGEGRDAYFGNLMNDLPAVRRLLHVDCPVERAQELSSGGKTASLHAWGSLWDGARLVGEYWSPRKELTQGAYGWLIRRAAANENSGGGPSMVRWQAFCQRRWLKSVRPARVIWPWENFAWERFMCRDSRSFGIATAGYQHTAIGPHQLNYSLSTNPDGEASLPDTILANGPAYAQEMIAWKIPKEKIVIAGSLRIKQVRQGGFNPDGPVFVPLSGQLAAARSQLKAAQAIANSGLHVRVKEHPMYPMAFAETQRLKRTTQGLSSDADYSSVLFTTGTSGLEAILAGIPAFRLLLEDRLSINILPSNIKVTAVTAEHVAETMATAGNPPTVNWDDIFSEPNLDTWRALLSPKA